ncbi:Agamous-like MADS-box protein AGL62 [Triticum urartu]|uniref:Agamous-like MADS-box protein AGL62 n=1 Tax=Triticum urartu TaxID=4572 RepID=M7ZRB1_TRIUA|nr:Agamous-like MADS-box protein AGL62 [Triticum urartu]
MAAPNRRGGSGRKKTVVRRIEQEDARHVSYAKRRAGLFNKASELAVLTRAQVAALAFSPGGKAFTFGHPSVDSVVERFLAGEGLGACPRAQGAANDRFLAAEGAGAGAGAGEGAADEDNVKRLAQQLAEMRAELTEVKKQKKRIDKAMAKERAAGDQIAAWVDPKVRDMGDDDMAAFFATLLKVKTDVSHRANQVLLDFSRKVEITRLPPAQIFGGSIFEFGSSSGSAHAGMEFQFLVPPPQGQGFEAGMDMHQTVMAALPPPQGFPSAIDMQVQQQMVMEMPPAQVLAAGSMNMQQQIVMEMPPAQVIAAGVDMQEMPPAQVVAAGMDMQEMPPPPGFAAGIDIMEQMQMMIGQPPSFEAGMETEFQQWLMAMPPPEFPAGLEMAQQVLEPNAEEEEI